jgi:hypothetical protein
MSPKELLYIDDTLGHERQIKACCTDSADKISDPELKGFIGEIAARHTQAFNRFYTLLD